ncbi:MAG: hypothetical protein KGL39_46740, partial [Patescibacteria group bacterium]|nr:hypothetical protein [Patescibacteria group bacterium]
LGVGGVATFTNNAVVKGTLQLPVIGSGTVAGWMGVDSSGNVVTNNPPAGGSGATTNWGNWFEFPDAAGSYNFTNASTGVTTANGFTVFTNGNTFFENGLLSVRGANAAISVFDGSTAAFSASGGTVVNRYYYLAGMGQGYGSKLNGFWAIDYNQTGWYPQRLGDFTVYSNLVAQATIGANSNAWSLATFTNGMANFSYRFGVSNNAAHNSWVSIYNSNGVPYMKVYATDGL